MKNIEFYNYWKHSNLHGEYDFVRISFLTKIFSDHSILQIIVCNFELRFYFKK